MNANKYWRLVRVVHELDPLAIPVEFGAAAASVAIPYLNVGFLGLLLMGVQARWRSTALLALTAGFLGARFVLTVLNDWLTKLAKDHTELVHFRLKARTTEKLLTVDYPAFQSAQLRAGYEGATRGEAMNGGMTSLLENGVHDLFSAVIAAGFAIWVLVQLITTRTPPTALGAKFLNSPGYAVTLLACLVLPVAIGAWASARGNRLQQAMIKKIITGNRRFTYFGQFVENFAHGMLTRLYHLQPLIHQAETTATTASNANYWRGQLSYLQYTLLPNLAMNLLAGGLYALIGLQALSGAITVGMVLIAVGYFQQFMVAVNTFSGELGWYLNMVDYLQYYADFFAVPDAAETGSLPVEKRTDDDFAIAFNDVSFKYPGSDVWALRHVNLTLNVGERLAIVGPNGSGKTTLVMLLTRLYRPTEGTVTLNGIDINKYDSTAYQSLLGVVFQDFRLFAYSLAENVAATTQPDEARVWAALKVANVADRVAAMPDQLNTAVGQALNDNGVALSGGEAQKVAIARAWYKDAPIMVLDEPTAALDPVSEAEVYTRFDALIGHKTAVYISHRMSSTQFAQRVVVFNHGHIVQDGTHYDLLATPGLYRDLFEAQAQHYTPEKVAQARATGDEAASVVTE